MARSGSVYVVEGVQIPINPKPGGHVITVNLSANWTLWTNITPGRCVNASLSHFSYLCEVAADGWLVIYEWIEDLTSKSVWLFQSSTTTTNGVSSSSTFGWGLGGVVQDYCNQTMVHQWGLKCPRSTYANATHSRWNVVGSVVADQGLKFRANNSYAILISVALYTESTVESAHAQLVGARASTGFDAFHGNDGIRLNSIVIG